MSANKSDDRGGKPEKKPFSWGRNPLRPWAYWTLVIVAVAIVVAVIVISVQMGVFVSR